MAIMSLTRSSLLPLLHMICLFLPQNPSNMLYRLVVAALITMSASVTSAAPVLDAGDALEARMAKLEATVNELEFAGKVAEEDDIKEEDVTEQRMRLPTDVVIRMMNRCLEVSNFEDVKPCIGRLAKYTRG